jgi:putative DNA primase/helicase
MKVVAILALLNGVQRADANQWHAHCPAHMGARKSLSISTGRQGRVLLKCHKGCTPQEICEAIGIEIRDLFQRPKDADISAANEIVYPYVDEAGTVLLEVVRTPEKKFRQRVPDGRGGYHFTTKGARRVPYRLPSLLAAAAANERIWIVEGEKDANCLAGLGLASTTNRMGAGKWLDEYSKHLKGAGSVVVIADRDEPGRKHANEVARSVLAVVGTVKVVEVSQERGSAKDASDWVERGATREDFDRLAESAPVFTGGATQVPSAATAIQFALTDLGNVDRLVAMFGDTVRYCVGLGPLGWDGRRWAPDANAFHAIAEKTVRSLGAEAAASSDSGRTKELLAFAIRCQAKHRIAAIADLASRDTRLAIAPEKLDRDPAYLNVANGTLTLDDGEFGLARSKDFLTKLAPVGWDPSATCPKWLRFLDDVFKGNKALVEFVQRAIGYSATGETREQVLLVAYGGGANGKSTLLETALAALGEYARAVPRELLVVRRNESHPTGVMHLRGARLVVANELDSGQKLNEALVKQLTGSDRITGRRMHQDFVEFTPTFKIWLSTNHLPNVSGTDHGIWRRLLVIPFAVTFSEGERNPHLPQELKVELPGILRWIVEGAVAWYERGLSPPPEVLEASKQYRADMDLVERFLQERCELQSDAKIPSKALYGAYVVWSREGETNPMGQRAFGIELRGRPAFRSSKSGGHIVWHGLRLRPPERGGVTRGGGEPHESGGEDGEERSSSFKNQGSHTKQGGSSSPSSPDVAEPTLHSSTKGGGS